jgi:hypothetical protein
MLARELLKEEDDFITVRLSGREYIIESISRVPDCVDGPTSHRCLDIREGGQGYIQR